MTNTLHFGGGELGISLNDMKEIGGLPILGSRYEEFLPSNKDLRRSKHIPKTVSELLRIHYDLCIALGTREISWRAWLAYFVREKPRYKGFGLLRAKSNSRELREKDTLFLQHLPPRCATSRGELAAFLVLLLCMFVFPTYKPYIRPETFVMACRMADSQQISLAPSALGHIYYGLSVAIQNSEHDARAVFGVHFVIGWLARYFPAL